MTESLLTAAALLFVVHALGAAPPLLARWSHRGLHFCVSVAAGVFLGAIFLHLLPELAERGGHEGPVSLLPWIAALGGLVLLFFLERIVLAQPGHATDPHALVWSSSYIGLSVHSFATGLGFAAVAADPALMWTFVGAMAVHKASESFSLATVMRLAGLPRRRAALLLAAYSASTPAGLLLGGGFALGALGASVSPVLAGLACGTFLYVAVGDLLPEVFHESAQRRSGTVGLLLGIGITAAGLLFMH
jgi:zinc transporter ZupT